MRKKNIIILYKMKKSPRRSHKKSAKRSPKKSVKRSVKRSAKKSHKKRKASPYIKFATKYFKEHKSTGKKATQLMKEAGAAWRKMSDAEKKKF